MLVRYHRALLRLLCGDPAKVASMEIELSEEEIALKKTSANFQ